MDRYLDNRHKEVLWNLLENPADTGQLYIQNLERLVNDYPQSGILQVMLARTGDQQQLSKAAVYFNPKVLHKLMYNPDNFQEVSASKVVESQGFNNGHENYFNIGTAVDMDTDTLTGVEDTTEQTEEATTPENNITEYTETITADYGDTQAEEDAAGKPEQATYGEQTEETANYEYVPQAEGTVDTSEQTRDEEPAVENQYEKYTQPETEPAVQQTEYGTTPEQYITPEADNDQQDTVSITSTLAEDNYRREDEHFRQDIDDEIFDEIVSIEDIGFETIANETTNPKPAADTEGESDYASFDQKLNELRNGGIPTEPSPVTETPAEAISFIHNNPQQAEYISESKNISRYNDDKMPYSFMWWLDKTRKEHAGNFQPYAAKPVPVPMAEEKPVEKEPAAKPITNNAADELQQQYYENIFSLTSISSIEGDAAQKEVAFDHNKKEDVIIERFIHTEPQIRPQAADKLDNENKAKKSSEDQDELVTETLARIYTDQMLYHKAIATYKKLILKFPEKKLYFAAQIEQLEKKTN